MVRSHCNVTKMVQAAGRHNRISAVIIFWTVMAVLSMSIIGQTAYAQNTGFSGGGALGSLLEQLQTLKDTGAIDALEGSTPTANLDRTREQGTVTLQGLQRDAKKDAKFFKYESYRTS